MSKINLGEEVKKLLLAGIGAAATTVEKSEEILDDLIRKGELTVEQGKILNQELKRTVRETTQKKDKEDVQDKEVDFEEFVKSLSPEEFSKLKEQMSRAENK